MQQLDVRLGFGRVFLVLPDPVGVDHPEGIDADVDIEGELDPGAAEQFARKFGGKDIDPREACIMILKNRGRISVDVSTAKAKAKHKRAQDMRDRL